MRVKSYKTNYAYRSTSSTLFGNKTRAGQRKSEPTFDRYGNTVVAAAKAKRKHEHPIFELSWTCNIYSSGMNATLIRKSYLKRATEA